MDEPSRPESLESHRREVDEGRRFAFGRNWQRFLRVVDEPRIAASQRDLLEMLDRSELSGVTFLDIGCGSGLSSLAALRAGAQVTAFDYDPEAVAATRALLEDRAPAGSTWRVLQGSVLDEDLMREIGHHDIVYSWGVLHHTGSMWQACEAAATAVPTGGTLFIALYNDAGKKSVVWTRWKQRYVGLPRGLRTVYAWSLIVAAEGMFLLRALRKGQPSAWLRRWTSDRPVRGMSRYRDWIDWIGGYPYEYASVDEVIGRMTAQGLTLRRLIENGGTGCNEFVLVRAAP